MFKIKVPKRFTRNVILSRMGNGSYQQGQWVDGLEQQRQIKVSFQPIQPGDYRLLPEGESPTGVYKAYWNGAFDYGVDGQRRSDHIITKGIRYKLIQYNDWSDAGFSVGLFRELKP